MSRTDRHRPHQVQLNDPLETNWFFERWPKQAPEKILLHRTCGCRLCGAYYWRKAENRQRRHDDQRRSRRAATGDLSAWDER